MKMIVGFCLLTTTLAVTACGSTSDGEPRVTQRPPTPAEVEQHNAIVDPADRIVCRMEKPIGSNITERVCRLVRDVEETSSFHREQLRRAL